MRRRTTLQQSQAPWPVRFLNKGAAVARRAGLGSSPLTAEHLIALARDKSGLDDFGSGDFFEPLSRLLESCHRDARLNLVGRIALRADTLHCLRNRLLLQRDRRAHPGIAVEKIQSPLFIVGLPRTGTTILHILLMADPEHRAPLTWEVMAPCPLGHAQKQERVHRSERSLAGLRWLAPAFPRLHAIGAELPQECVSLMSLSFLSDQFDTMYNIPSYRAWFFRQNLSPAYEWHRRFLQHLQFGRRPGRWVLKAPAHMFALPALLAAYPDARFVQTHRAPLDAITSVSSLITILRRIFSEAVDPVKIGREAMTYWAATVTNFLAERDRLASDRVCDLPYENINRDPIEAVRRVYAHFGWPLGDATERRMRRILARRSPNHVGFHHYEPAQFGLQRAEMAEMFASYCDRFQLPVQEKHAGKQREEVSSTRSAPRAVEFSLADNESSGTEEAA
ncbi:MAG TPA: sulfotransferase [Chthoniobacterales bacterium]